MDVPCATCNQDINLADDSWELYNDEYYHYDVRAMVWRYVMVAKRRL
jgi:hypothetical protein